MKMHTETSMPALDSLEVHDVMIWFAKKCRQVFRVEMPSSSTRNAAKRARALCNITGESPLCYALEIMADSLMVEFYHSLVDVDSKHCWP